MLQDNDYFIPLQDQSVFGVGIKRKRVTFVPATTISNPKVPDSTSAEIGEYYLSVVLKNNSVKKSKVRERTTSESPLNEIQQQSSSKVIICDICHIAIQDDEGSTRVNTKGHETSIAHQVCLSHSYPPSHLDRNRKGLKYLSSCGWDPDGRVGLGAAEDGILAPIRAKIKNDTVGLGVKRKGKGEDERKITPKVQKLDAKKVRKKEYEIKKHQEHLQDIFYRDEDIEKYLGHG